MDFLFLNFSARIRKPKWRDKYVTALEDFQLFKSLQTCNLTKTSCFSRDKLAIKDLQESSRQKGWHKRNFPGTIAWKLIDSWIEFSTFSLSWEIYCLDGILAVAQVVFASSKRQIRQLHCLKDISKQLDKTMWKWQNELKTDYQLNNRKQRKLRNYQRVLFTHFINNALRVPNKLSLLFL